MTTQNTNPIADLMSDLGIGMEEPTANGTSNDENLSVNSDTPTNDGETEALDTGNTKDSNTDVNNDALKQLEDLKAELEKANKRISDKDRYINELKNSNKKEESNNVESGDDEFWSNPDGMVKNLKNEILNLRNELAEQRYAATKPDYWDYVKSDDVMNAMQEDASFTEGLKEASNPYSYAYDYFKAKQESTKAKEELSTKALKDKLRAEILEELKAGNNKETVPSIRNIGNSSGKVSEDVVDGFAAVFGRKF